MKSNTKLESDRERDVAYVSGNLASVMNQGSSPKRSSANNLGALMQQTPTPKRGRPSMSLKRLMDQ